MVKLVSSLRFDDHSTYWNVEFLAVLHFGEYTLLGLPLVAAHPGSEHPGGRGEGRAGLLEKVGEDLLGLPM